MIDLSEISKSYSDDIESVTNWTNEIYEKYFSHYFEYERQLYDRLKAKDKLITDSELEWILTSLPLELFSVAEQLSQFQLSEEVIKLRIKQEEKDKILESTASSETKRKEEASHQMLENKLLITVYNAVVDRVSREMSFSRELIMSAKKVWDARKRTEDANPINPVSSDESKDEDVLPGYNPSTSGKTYIT